MAWTSTDLSTIETAIASGTLRVQFADRMVEYRSISELLKARDAMKTSLETTASTSRTSYVEHSRG